jgi:ankyrin repeat protein
MLQTFVVLGMNSAMFLSFTEGNFFYLLYTLYHRQTALMQACQHGHWEVVQTLIIFKANVRSLLQTDFVLFY